MTPYKMSELHSRCMPNYQNWSANYYRTLLKSKNSIFHIEEFGFGFARFSKDEGEIIMIMIDPSFRHKGRATLLLKKLLDDLKSIGCKKIFLEVGSNNEGAIALYKKNNFEKIGERKEYYSLKTGGKLNALVFQKVL
ncbi:MAG: GNAT family N-acetyltransferase [Paracoccaceae bacterium]|nr:GNAT family N-acetyltransferase [Paracoccaceae bacterium]